MDGMTIYWITRLVALNDFFCKIVVVGATASIIMGIGMGLTAGPGEVSGEDLKKFCTNYFRPVVIITISALFISIFTPNKDDMILIAGAEVTKNVATELAPEGKMLREWVDDELQKKIGEGNKSPLTPAKQ